MSTNRTVRLAAALAALTTIALGAPAYADEAPDGTTTEAAQEQPAAKPAGYLPTATWQLLAEVNKHRRAKGLRALTVDKRLAASARAWAERMAATGTLAHNDPLFSKDSHRRLHLRVLGENVGFDAAVVAQHRAFLASPHHRANVELRSFRVAGFAVVRDRNGYLWSVEDFGTPAG